MKAARTSRADFRSGGMKVQALGRSLEGNIRRELWCTDRREVVFVGGLVEEVSVEPPISDEPTLIADELRVSCGCYFTHGPLYVPDTEFVNPRIEKPQIVRCSDLKRRRAVVKRSLISGYDSDTRTVHEELCKSDCGIECHSDVVPYPGRE